jgi:hypothetical protein
MFFWGAGAGHRRQEHGVGGLFGAAATRSRAERLDIALESRESHSVLSNCRGGAGRIQHSLWATILWRVKGTKSREPCVRKMFRPWRGYSRRASIRSFKSFDRYTLAAGSLSPQQCRAYRLYRLSNSHQRPDRLKSYRALFWPRSAAASCREGRVRQSPRA